MSDAPRLTVVHRMPGRIRLSIDGIRPDWVKLENDLRGHPGINVFRFSELIGTVVVDYDRKDIAEAEVVLRIGLSLSVAAGLSPIVVEREAESGDMHPEATIVGAALIVLGIIRFIPGLNTRLRLLDWASAFLAGGSVLAHAAGEFRRDGTFHPETLSVVYLLVSLAQGKGYTGSVLTWLASYGRHFHGRYIEELIIRAEPKGNGRGRRKRYEVTLENGAVKLAGNAFVGTLPALIAHAIAGGKPGDEALLTDFRKVSETHGHMLEGLEGMAEGITMNIR